MVRSLDWRRYVETQSAVSLHVMCLSVDQVVQRIILIPGAVIQHVNRPDLMVEEGMHIIVQPME